MCYHVAIVCIAKRRGSGRAQHTLVNYAIAMGILVGIVVTLGAASMVMEHYRQFHQANFSRLQTGLPIGIAGITFLVTILEVAVLFPELCKLWQQRQVEVLYRSRASGPPEDDQPLDLPDTLVEEAEVRSAMETQRELQNHARETGEELSGSEAL